MMSIQVPCFMLLCVFSICQVSARTPHHHHHDLIYRARHDKPRVYTLTSWSWKQCGSKTDVIQIKSLDISPDELRIPGPVYISTSFSVSKPLQAPIKMVVEIKKKIFGWHRIRCRNGEGSCTYNDICNMTKPSRCPFPQGKFTIPKTKFDLPKIHVPHFFERGHYWASIKLSHPGENILCVEANFRIR